MAFNPPKIKGINKTKKLKSIPILGFYLKQIGTTMSLIYIAIFGLL